MTSGSVRVIAVRAAVIVVCVAGVAGMIVASILDNSGAALTFGLVTAVAVLCLMVATAVTTAARPVDGEAGDTAMRLEAAVAELVAAGTDEAPLRNVVREAVRLGRQTAAEERNPP